MAKKILFIFAGILLVFIKAKPALVFSLVSSNSGYDHPLVYNRSTIRQACMQVHGEEWFKKNVIAENKYGTLIVDFFSNNMLQVTCRSLGKNDSKDLMDLKAIFDYMADRNDTIYVEVPQNRISGGIGSDSLNDYLRWVSWMYYESSVLRCTGRYLRVGEAPMPTDPELMGISILPIFLNSLCEFTDIVYEYREKCANDNYHDLSSSKSNLRNEGKIRQEDIDLYYDYIVEQDEYILSSRPEGLILTGIRYEKDPNAIIFFGTSHWQLKN